MNTTEIVRNLAGIDWRFGNDEIGDVLAQAGWNLVSTAEPRRQWQRGDTMLHTISRAGSVYRVKVYLDVWSLEDVIDEDDDDWSYQEVEAGVYARYNGRVAEVSAVLGPPAYDVNPNTAEHTDLADRGVLPDDCWQVALWPLPGASLMVVCDWQDKDVPMMVTVWIQPFAG